MKLSTKSRIAIDAMIDVAIHGARLPVALATVSERQRVSLSYLEQLFRRLRARGFVKSSRGPGGGYQVGKRPSAISIADIVNTVEDAPDGRTRRGKRLGLADGLWARLDRHLLDYLRTVTLESVLQQAGYRADAEKAGRRADAPIHREERHLVAA